MKRILLSFGLLLSVAYVKAQTILPLQENFTNGVPPGWEGSFDDVNVLNYSVNTPSGCVSNASGLVINSNGGNGNILSPEFGFISNGDLVSIQFNLYAYNNSQLTCQNQITSTCNTSVRLYLVHRDHGDPVIPSQGIIYGQSALLPVALTNNGTQATVSVPVSTAIPANTPFKLLVAVNFGGCPGSGGNVWYVVDNVLIAVTEQAPLPVAFKSFTADRQGGSAVSIKWTTASEQGNRGFNVQRKTGNDWKTVAFVPSASNGGNSSSELSYQFNAANAEKGVSQYRIEQVDYDGKSVFSIIRAVRGAGQGNKIVIYPNPTTSGAVSIVFEDNNSLKDIVINDAQGRIIKQYRGISENILVVEKLQTGFYTVKIMDRTTARITFEKIVVQ